MHPSIADKLNILYADNNILVLKLNIHKFIRGNNKYIKALFFLLLHKITDFKIFINKSSFFLYRRKL